MNHLDPGSCPVVAALAARGFIPVQAIFVTDQSRGLLFLGTPQGRCGLLRWDRPDAHRDPEALAAAVVWAHHGRLLRLAEEAEREQGFSAILGADLVSTALRTALRAMSS